LFDAADGASGIDVTPSSLVESVDLANFRLDSTPADKSPIETKRSAAKATHNVASKEAKTSKSFGLEELCADKSEKD
jgi:hypothetical protein